MTASSRRFVGFRIGLVLVLLGIVLLVALRRKHEPVPVVAGSADVPTSARGTPSRGRLPRTGGPESSPAGDLAFLEATKAQYLAYAVYPPWSRPATAAYGKHVWWNQPMHFDAEVTVADDPIKLRLTLDKLQYRPDEPAVATLSAWRGEQDAPQSAIELEAELLLQTFDEDRAREEKAKGALPPETPGWRDVLEATFEATPKLNERQVTFVPSQAIASANNGMEDGSPRVLAKVKVTIPDEGDEEGQGQSEYYRHLVLPIRISEVEPIVVLDKIGERVANGSLEIDFLVEVTQLGKVSVRTTLWNADGTYPIAIYDGPFSAPSTDRPAAVGRQVITVIFFGRVLREAGLDGPYKISPLRGQVLLDDPPKTAWFRDDQSWVTKAYEAEEFAGAEWDDEVKQRKIEMYDRLIEEAGGPAGRRE